MKLKLNAIVKANIFFNERMGKVKGEFLKSHCINMNYQIKMNF